MSISPLASYNSQSTQSSALQALLAQIQATNHTQTGTTTATGDQVSVSPIAQYLSKAPKEIAASLQDLVTARKDITADLKALKTYYTAHPEERTKLNTAMQLQGLNPALSAAMPPAMQAGIVDLYAMSSELGSTSGSNTSTKDQGKAILALLQRQTQTQGSLFDGVSGMNQTGSNQDSLFSYLS